jgi:SAM-dependent methyltransferase
MDELAKFNKERWEELAQNGVIYSQPFFDLNPQSARDIVDPVGVMGDVRGKDVLCLASGGGQQSAAFGLLRANVTMFDISETQLRKDSKIADHYNLNIQTVQGDMRDLSAFADNSFDVVWHAYSINFIPETNAVFNEVARVLRPNGLYRLECANPFVFGLDEADWLDTGYGLKRPYLDGAEVEFTNPDWEIHAEDGTITHVKGPREFRHTLSTVVNGLISRGFSILGVWEETGDQLDAAPGTWEHLKLIAPPWLTFWAVYQPNSATTATGENND